MSLKGDLFTYLSTQPGITAIISAKVFPEIAPTSEDLPYITFAIMSTENVHNFDAASRFSIHHYQIDCWGTTALEADNLAEAVREELDGFNNALMGTTDIRSIRLLNQSDEFELFKRGSQKGSFRVRTEYNISHFRSVPTFP